MKITATALTQLDANRSYYLSNTTGTIKEAGFWQKFKCYTGLGDGRAKVARLADAIKTALLADAAIKGEAKLSAELDGLDKTRSLSGASLRQIATRFKADHAQAIATSDAYRTAEKIADEQIRTWVERGDVLPEEQSLKYIKKLALYAAQQVTDDAYAFRDDPAKLTRKIRRNMEQPLICLNCAENMKKRDIGYPLAGRYTAADGRERELTVPRFRLDELHFRAILAAMATKDGPATFMNFTRALLRLPEAELQKRKEAILSIHLEGHDKLGSGVAFAAQAAKSHELYNSSILPGIKTSSMNVMPDAFNKAEDEVVEEVRQRFGAQAIGEFCHATSLMNITEHLAAISPLVETANLEGRTIRTEEVKDAIREKCIRGGALAVLDGTFKEIARERNLGSANYSLSATFARQNPAVIDEIAACETPEAARAAARRYEEAIAARLQLNVDAKKTVDELGARAAAMIADATGMSVEYVSARLNVDRLKTKGLDVADGILSGKIEGADKPGFDLKAAFNGVLDKFVKERLAVLKEVDEIKGLSANLRRQWKNHALSTYRAEKLHPAKIRKLFACGHFSDKQLSDALDVEGTAAAAEKICSYMGGVNAHFVELFGADEWEDMGDDERDPVLSMALMAVIDRNPSIAEKFLGRREELMNAVNEEFNRDEFVEQGHGRKVVEGLYAILVGVDGRKDGE